MSDYTRTLSEAASRMRALNVNLASGAYDSVGFNRDRWFNQVHEAEHRERVRLRQMREQRDARDRLAQQQTAQTRADRRAEALLVEHLDDAQLDDFRSSRRGFWVRGSIGGRYFISAYARSNAIFSQRELRTMCAVVPGDVAGLDVPVLDQALTLKLMIEHDEHLFRQVAY